MRAVHLAELVGDALYLGFTYGGTLYFTSNDTFDKADYPGLRAVKVMVQAGGGQGGGAGTTGAGQSSCGEGGGGGEYAEKFILVDTLAASETVTVGAGGTGAGGTSSFGSHVSAAGGTQGSFLGATSTTRTADGVAGGTGGTGGDLHIAGGAGRGCLQLGPVAIAGSGGESRLAGGTQQRAQFGIGNGYDGQLYGGGGGGGMNDESNGNARTGGLGAQGIVIVEVYF